MLNQLVACVLQPPLDLFKDQQRPLDSGLFLQSFIVELGFTLHGLLFGDCLTKLLYSLDSAQCFVLLAKFRCVCLKSLELGRDIS